MIGAILAAVGSAAGGLVSGIGSLASWGISGLGTAAGGLGSLAKGLGPLAGIAGDVKGLFTSAPRADTSGVEAQASLARQKLKAEIRQQKRYESLSVKRLKQEAETAKIQTLAQLYAAKLSPRSEQTPFIMPPAPPAQPVGLVDRINELIGSFLGA